MSSEELLHQTVENFLQEQRKNLLQDRESVTALLKEIFQEQQIFEVESITRKENLFNTQENIIEEKEIAPASRVITDTEYCDNHSLVHSRKLREFNSQTEKERLARLFENAPNALSWSYRKQKEFQSSRGRKNSKHDLKSEDKENIFINIVCDTDHCEKIAIRCGEFSPLNPAFRSNKKVLELGDYEQLRKKFVENKKGEYVQYFQNDNVKRKAESERCNAKLLELRLTSNKIEQLSSETSLTSSNVLFTSCGDRKSMSDLKKCHQAAYRRELDKQIEEKKKLQEKEKEYEKLNCEFWSNEEMKQKENLMKDIEKKFCQRIRYKNLNIKEPTSEVNVIKREDNQYSTSSSQSNKFKKNQRENYNQVIKCRQSPILKPTVEACAVDNYEEYRKMQRELYKRDLAEQIEEKKKIEKERKLKEIEIERKIEESVQKEAEKLRLQYEKEQAERNHRATQKAQLEKQLQDNLCRIKKQNENRKKIKKVTSPEACHTYPTNHQVNEKPKNVTFASHALEHCISTDHWQEKKSTCSVSSDDERVCTMEATIVQAPYILAIKNHSFNDNFCASVLPEKSRSPSPIVPAVRTQNLINSLPKTNYVEIPAGVSMSEQAKTRLMKDERILSNLSKIRRKLLENQCGNSCNNA